MKIRKILSVVAAAALAVSAMTVNSFAALYEDSIEVSGGPANNDYLLAGAEGVDYSKVAKIEAVVTTTDYVNGTIGVSVNGEWTTPGQLEATGGTATWVLDNLSGIDAVLEDGSLKTDVVHVQFWWLNAGSFTLDSLKLLDAEGNVLQEAGVDVAPPAGDNTGNDEGPAFDKTYKATIAFADAAWAAQDWETTIDVNSYGTYSIKPNVDSFNGFVVFCIDIPELGADLGVEPGSGAYDMTKCTISDLKVIVDGSEIAVDMSKLLWGDPEEKGNLRIEIYNEYGNTKDASPVDKTVSGSTLEVQFTLAPAGESSAPVESKPEESKPEENKPEESDKPIEGNPSAGDKNVVDEPNAAGDVGAATDDKNSPDTGVEGIAVVAGMATVAALAVVIAKKRK